MDKTLKHRDIVKQLLTQYNELLSRCPIEGAETEVIFDEERDHYLLFNVGWSPQGRVRGATLYIRLRNGKFWIEEDWTEEGFANQLLEAGIPKEEIVLAFQPPNMRPYTEFALA
jgi:hypothetical protein